MQLPAQDSLLDRERKPIVKAEKESLGIVWETADTMPIDVDSVDSQLIEDDVAPSADLFLGADRTRVSCEYDRIWLRIGLLARDQIELKLSQFLLRLPNQSNYPT